MSIVRKFILKINQRQGEPATTHDQIMRLRSGTEYHLVNQQEEDSDVVFDEGVEMPAPMNDNAASNMSMMRSYPFPMQNPVAVPVPMPMRNLIPRQRGRNQSNWSSRLRSIFNGAMRVVQSLPGILTTVAGINAVIEIIYPPEQRVEVIISQQPWWQWW